MWSSFKLLVTCTHSYAHTHTQTHKHTHACIHTRTHTLTHTNTHTHAYTHTHTHTDTHKHTTHTRVHTHSSCRISILSFSFRVARPECVPKAKSHQTISELSKGQEKERASTTTEESVREADSEPHTGQPGCRGI